MVAVMIMTKIMRMVMICKLFAVISDLEIGR